MVADALGQVAAGRTGLAIGLPGIFPLGGRTRACGPAFTVRYEASGHDDGQGAGPPVGASFDFGALFARARCGDIAVFETPEALDCAVLGSMGIAWADHFGVAGCVINGAVRDVEALAASGMPVWARRVTPLAGRGRLVQAEVCGPVTLGGAVVLPGDLVVADGNGVAVIPTEKFGAVSHALARIQQAEAVGTRALRADRERRAVAGGPIR